MAGVMIGVDPHKASHTAVAVSGDEQPLGQVRVRASAAQARRLLEWAAPLALPRRSLRLGKLAELRVLGRGWSGTSGVTWPEGLDDPGTSSRRTRGS